MLQAKKNHFLNLMQNVANLFYFQNPLHLQKFKNWNSKTVEKIYKPLIEIYQLLIVFINGMLLDNFLLTVMVSYLHILLTLVKPGILLQVLVVT